MNSELFEDTVAALRQLRHAFMKQGLEPPFAMELNKRAAAALAHSAEEDESDHGNEDRRKRRLTRSQAAV